MTLSDVIVGDSAMSTSSARLPPPSGLVEIHPLTSRCPTSVAFGERGTRAVALASSA